MIILTAIVVCRPPSALGLEQPGDTVESPTPEPERETDVAAMESCLGTTTATELLVPGENLAPTSSEVRAQDASAGQVEGPPPSAGVCLLEAQLLTADKVVGTP